MASPVSVGFLQTPETPQAGDSLYSEESLRALPSRGQLRWRHLFGTFPQGLVTPRCVSSLMTGLCPQSVSWIFFGNCQKSGEPTCFFVFFFNNKWLSCYFTEMLMNSKVTKQCLEANSRGRNSIHWVHEMSNSRLSAVRLLAHLIFPTTFTSRKYWDFPWWSSG